MRILDVGALVGIVTLLTMAGKVMKHWISAGYKFTKTWQDLVKGMADLVGEVKNIKRLMEDGRDWMIRGDEKFKRHEDDIASLQGQMSDHKDRIARLEGRP